MPDRYPIQPIMAASSKMLITSKGGHIHLLHTQHLLTNLHDIRTPSGLFHQRKIISEYLQHGRANAQNTARNENICLRTGCTGSFLPACCVRKMER